MYFGFFYKYNAYLKRAQSFLSNQLAEINEQILRIEASELLQLSQQDALTQISNRRTFDEMFDFFYYRANQEKRPLAVLFIDIDFFKNYNDFYGHQMGTKSSHLLLLQLKTRFVMSILLRVMGVKSLSYCYLKHLHRALILWQQIFVKPLNDKLFLMPLR